MVEETSEATDLEADVDAALEACGGNTRAAIRALLIMQSFYQSEIARLEADVERLAEAVSAGFTRRRSSPSEANQAG